MDISDHEYILRTSERVRADALRMRRDARSMLAMARAAVDASRQAVVRARQQQERMLAQVERAHARRERMEALTSPPAPLEATSRGVRNDVRGVDAAAVAQGNADRPFAAQLLPQGRRTPAGRALLPGSGRLISTRTRRLHPPIEIGPTR